MLTLLMARHGQTALNAEDRWQGRLDEPLNAEGLAQAEALVGLVTGPVDALIVSPLLRARQTAAPVASRLGLTPRIDTAFRERDYGVFDGLTAADAIARYPDQAAANAAYRWDTEPTGAEPARAVVDRVTRGLAELRARHPHGTVLLVSHGFVMRCLRYVIDQQDDDTFFSAPRVPNGALLTRHFD